MIIQYRYLSVFLGTGTIACS